MVLTNNSYRVGLSLFAIGVIIFFAQGYVLSFFNIIVSMFIPPDTPGYQMMLQAYIWTYTLALVLIISGVVVFYKARKESNSQASAPAAESE